MYTPAGMPPSRQILTSSGSLNTIYSHSDSSRFTVLVINCGTCDSTAFVNKLLESTGTEVKTDQTSKAVSFCVGNEWKTISFIEVDVEKDDLWTSLSFNGCILLFRATKLQSYKNAIAKLGYLKERKEKYGLWVVGIVNDPAATNRLFFQRAVTSAEASATAKESGAHYWEVIPDGKTARSPLVYNQIVMEIISTIGDFEVSALPKKIPLEFNSSEVKRKVFRSCEHLTLINAQL